MFSTNIDLLHQLQSNWEKGPFCFSVHSTLTVPQLWKAVKAASTLYRSKTMRPNIRVWVANALVQSDIDDCLPTDGDSTCEMFWSRIRSAPIVPSAIMFNHIHVYDHEVWCAVRATAESIYERVGWPRDCADADVLIGDYANTPFGVHLDTGSTISLVLIGNKDYLFWGPESPVRDCDHRGKARYDNYRDGGIVHSVGEGSAVYWPSTHWHVAETDARLSLSVQLAFYVGDRSQQDLLSAISGLPFNPASLSSTVGSPFECRDSLLSLVSDLSTFSSEALQAAVLSRWLRWFTGSGFRQVPPPCKLNRDLPDTLVRVTGSRLASVHRPGYLIVAANGHSFEVDDSPRLIDILTMVADCLPGREIVRPSSIDNGVGELLNMLHSCHVIAAQGAD